MQDNSNAELWAELVHVTVRSSEAELPETSGYWQLQACTKGYPGA